jgi:hypothetical protein
VDEQKRVKVVISPLGVPTIEAIGFNGVGCTDATAPIERALAGGNGSVDRVLKPEWYSTETAQEQEQVRW